MWDDSNFNYTDAYWDNQDGSMGDMVLSDRARASLDDYLSRKRQAAAEADADITPERDHEWNAFVSSHFFE